MNKKAGLENFFLLTDKEYEKSTVDAMADRLIAHLQKNKLVAGDVVVVMTVDQTQVFTSVKACFSAGYVLVCLDPSISGKQLNATLNVAQPKAVIADNNILDKLDINTIADAALLDASTKTPKRQLFLRSLPRWTTTDSIFRNTEGTPLEQSLPQSTIDDALPAYIMFTSGTTGDPKGVVVSRSALKKHVKTLSQAFNYGDCSRLLCSLPAYHTDGLVHGCYVPLLTGMSVVRPGKFALNKDFISSGLDKGATHYLTVPTVLSMLVEFYQDKPDLFTTYNTTVISTAGVLDINLWQSFERTFNVSLLNFYGMTETISGALYCTREYYKIGSVGVPLGVECRLMADNKVINQPDKNGELQLRGEQLLSHYVGDDENKTTSDEGWFSTGDIMFRDSDGFYFFVSRCKDIIKKGGVTILPQPIKQHLSLIEGVSECEVIGYPDPVFEEIIIVCLTNSSLETAVLTQHCKNGLPEEMLPDQFVFLNNIPKTAVGKVDRDKLLDLIGKYISEKCIKQMNTINTDSRDGLEEQIITIAASAFESDELSIKGKTKDQINGWDSYAHLKFIKQLENSFNIRMKARDIMHIDSVQDAIDTIRQKTENDIQKVGNAG